MISVCTQDLSLFIAKWVEYRYLQLYEVIGFLSQFSLDLSFTQIKQDNA